MALKREQALARAGAAITAAVDAADVRRVAQCTAEVLLGDLAEARIHVALSTAPWEPPATASTSVPLVIGIPFSTRSGTVGALQVRASRPLPAATCDALQALAVLVSLGLHSVRSAAELTHRANYDSLTSAANRSGLLQHLRDKLVACSPEHVVGLLLVDLDGFKAVNDAHGHAAGDQVLVAVAARLGSQLRSCDVLGRLGGDEFVILVPELPLAHAHQVLCRRAAHLTEAVGEPVMIEGIPYQVGASVGSAVSAGACAGDVETLTSRVLA